MKTVFNLVKNSLVYIVYFCYVIVAVLVLRSLEFYCISCRYSRLHYGYQTLKPDVKGYLFICCCFFPVTVLYFKVKYKTDFSTEVIDVSHFIC